jgi:hypothetical protein
MPETPKPEPLTHRGADQSDDVLAAEASAHLARLPSLQLMAELLTRLREMRLPWWTPDHLRKAYGAADRMGWLAERPDLRQRITSELTGLAPKAARKKAPEFQAALIDSVIDDGDITVAAFEAAFDPADLAVYAPVSDLWRLFRRRMPWEDDATAHQDLVGWLVGALLADKSSLDAAPRTPILTPWHVRTAIDGRVWHARIPLDVRVAIDEARLRRERERPGDPFHAAHDLAHAPPALIAASIPLKDLVPVLDVAGRAMGFELEPTEPSARPGRDSLPPPALASGRPPAPAPAPAVADEETAEPPGAAAPPALVDEAPGPEVEVGFADPDDLPPIGDEDDPMARTNPWELDGSPAPLDGIGAEPTTDDAALPGASSVSRRGKRRR